MTLEEKLFSFTAAELADHVNEDNLSKTIQKSKEAFWKAEAARSLTWFEFIYQQSFYIRKIWWILQAGILLFLWALLCMADSDYETRRCIGILAPLFVILILPELWKNETSHSQEVECTALYSLRKIVAARMILFGMVDLLLLTAFLSVSLVFLGFSAMQMIIQFLLPLLVTCCICLRTFGSRIGGIIPSLASCLIWSAVWTLILMRDEIYCVITAPIWMTALVVTVLYLCYCVMRVWRDMEPAYQCFI